MKPQLPGTILVVDDEPSARALLERVLTRGGHQVTLAETAEKALEHLDLARFELIIADKNLPGMNGLELIRIAREKWPSLQAILITGYPSPAAIREATAVGVFEYLTKPFGVLEIVAVCDSAIRAGRAAAGSAVRPIAEL